VSVPTALRQRDLRVWPRYEAAALGEQLGELAASYDQLMSPAPESALAGGRE
jgi:hypothetical protein